MNSRPAPAEVDRERAAVYAPEVVAQLPRLLSSLDREPYSPSYGSFDREHWGWKFRDFPITMLQTALHPLALLWRFPFSDNPCYASPRVLGWMEAAIANTCRRQHANGAFDSVGPYTQDHGVTLAMVYSLTETLRLLAEELSPVMRGALEEVVLRSCRFALRSSEDYAFISNHQALFAAAFLNAYELLEEAKYHQRAEDIIERILREQSPDGWYREYEGPDPGYESLSIYYLATCWRRTGSPRLLDSLRRSVEFYGHCVHPDGSVGGVYGSRYTSLYFPGGFEILAAEIPTAAAIGRFMRERLTRRNVLTPAVSDAENLPALALNYLEACLAPEAERCAGAPPLPCEALDGLRHFPDSAISLAGSPRYYAVVNASKGGVCRVFDKQTGKIAYEDAGYLVRAGRRRWTSQIIGFGQRLPTARADEVACATSLAEVRQELPTPAKFILLRALNLTLFRNLAVGSWLRRLILARLITAKHRGPLRFNRTITFGASEIRFRDRLELERAIRVDEVALPRSFTAIHAGSAKYFHLSELQFTPQAPVAGMALDLQRSRGAERTFALRFAAAAAPDFATGPAASEMDASPVQVPLQS